MLEWCQVLALKNLSTTRDILKLFFIFLIFGFHSLPSPLHKTHLGPLLLPLRRAKGGGWLQLVQQINTSTLCHIFFHQYYFCFFWFRSFWIFIQNVNKMVWTCPRYEGEEGVSCKWREGGVVGGSGRVRGGRGPGKCATDYYGKSSLKTNYETNIYYTPYSLQH